MFIILKRHLIFDENICYNNLKLYFCKELIIKKAFTLIELLIVILIIGIIYTLAITNFQNITNPTKKLTIENLGHYLNSFQHKKDVKFLCLDDCSSCNIFVDGEIVKELKGSFDNFIDDSIRVYKYSYLDGYIKKEFTPYFNHEGIEEDVCFSFSIDKNGISDQILLEYNNKFYDFSSNLSTKKIYNSIEEATEAKENLKYKILK